MASAAARRRESLDYGRARAQKLAAVTFGFRAEADLMVWWLDVTTSEASGRLPPPARQCPRVPGPRVVLHGLVHLAEAAHENEPRLRCA